MATTNLNIRVDENLKKEAEVLFSDLGLNMSTAITMFLRSAINYNGIPFEVRKPSASVPSSLSSPQYAVAPEELFNKVSDALLYENREAYQELAK
ncbi:MAG: type II toxin-antitoxin system RelB/DinJ family antitoxin [Clostridia bacterium]|nr:type II toxin-antitoxin system RelB/DinJ family antitoxin [Clostridia bacterium]